MNNSNITLASNFTYNTTFDLSAENVTDIMPINSVDNIWIMVSSTLVFLMAPGLGIYYGGYVQRKNVLSIYFSIFLSVAIISIQWFLIGFSLTFSSTGSNFIGNFDNAVLMNVGNANNNPVAPTLSSNVFMLYQSLFAAITPCLFFGSIAERGTLTSFVFILPIWTTFVYDFIAYWTWNKNGWLNILGALDFAGGGPVHIASGFSGLAYAIAVGPRINVDFKKLKPINLGDVFLGTGILWFGWMGFNGGSELACNSRAINAIVVSNLAAAIGGITWMVLEMIFGKTKKISINAFCTGAISGLVGITPASGYVSPASSLAIGFIVGFICFLGCCIKKLTKYKFDDTCDVFAVHGISGMAGSLLTGIFAQNSIAVMSGDAPIPGGFLDGNFIQLAYQLAAVSACAIWSFLITFIIVKVLDFIPFIQLRLNEDEQNMGADYVEMGEIAYGVEIDEKEKNFINRKVVPAEKFIKKDVD